MPLNARQQKFVEAFIQTGSATQAAQAAQYSAKTAYAIGSRLLKNVEVRQAIDQAQAQAARTAGIETAAIVRALAAIGLAHVDEPVRRSHQLRALQVLLQHVSVEDLATRVAALEALMQHGPHLNGRREYAGVPG